MVMMCRAWRVLMASMIAAMVVLLPEPVGPVTSASPPARSASLPIAGGQPRSSTVRIFDGITRSTAPGPFSCRKRLTRKRATDPSA